MTMASVLLAILWAWPVSAQTDNPDKPTWWDKYQYLAKYGPDPSPGPTTSLTAAYCKRRLCW